MQALIEQIKAHHIWKPPLAGTNDLLRQLESKHNCVLPTDFREFYQNLGEVILFEDIYRFMPLTEIVPVGLLQAGEEEQGWCDPLWYAFCDLHDGNYVGLALASGDILDCYHESMGSCTVIAKSLTEFLTRILSSAGTLYWLSPTFVDYGEINYEPSPEFYRMLDKDWWESLGEESSTENCKSPDCARKQIRMSTMCRRHHYEMIMRRECPFEEFR